MIISVFKRVMLLVGVSLLTASWLSVVAATSEDLRSYLPDRLGTFRRAGGLEPPNAKLDGGEFDVQTVYVGANGSRLMVRLKRVQQDGRAYELLTTTARDFRKGRAVEINSNIGTAGFVSSDLVGFFKGPHFVWVSFANPRGNEKD